jgi:hypothetical protein
MTPWLEVVVLRRDNKRLRAKGKAQIGVGAGETMETDYYVYLLEDQTFRKLTLDVPLDALKVAAKTGQLSLAASGEVSDTFALPGFGPALNLLSQCAVDLGKRWGFAPEQQKRLARPAAPLKPLGEYFSSADYPRPALKNFEMGRSMVRIAVDQSVGQRTARF